MADVMEFPNTWEEYEKMYGFNDIDQVYTNGSRLIPRICAYAHKYRVDVTITFGADGDAELKVEPTYWDKDTRENNEID